MAYPGCYALSKVLEEVMVEQYGVQYGIDWCCLRAVRDHGKDDSLHAFLRDDLFGGPDWKTMISPIEAERSRATGAASLLMEWDGTAVKRNFVHVDDLVEAIVLALTAKTGASAALQYLHGRTGRLRSGCRVSQPNPRRAQHRFAGLTSATGWITAAPKPNSAGDQPMT